MQKGQFKIQRLDEIRICKNCNEEKIVTDFVKGKGTLYRYLCKECKNKKRRKGTVNTGRFKPGHSLGVRYQKGNVPWFKIKNVEHPATKSSKRFTSLKYKKWRHTVFEKCNHKCKKCSVKENLHAHHKIAWVKNENLRFDENNGIVLCSSCHAKEEGFGTKIRPIYIKKR